MLVAEGDGVVVEGNDAGIGDGNAEDVAGEVIEHGLLALAPWGAMDDPGLAPGGVGDGEVRAFVGERRLELAAHQLGQGLDREEEGLAGGVPITAIGRNAAAGDKAMDVGMEDELLGPGVEHGENADGSADEAAVAAEVDEGP